jgi:hypothetical protein
MKLKFDNQLHKLKIKALKQHLHIISDHCDERTSVQSEISVLDPYVQDLPGQIYASRDN